MRASIRVKGFFLLTVVLFLIPGAVHHVPAQDIFLKDGDTWPMVPMSPERSDDSYAIYSLLVEEEFPIDPMQHMPQWLIADTTMVASEEWTPPSKGITPPLSQQQAFAAVLADYDKHKYERVHLEREFHLFLPYQLLNRKELVEYQELKIASDAAQDNSMPSKYQGAPGLIYFSNVSFDFYHTMALVYVAHWCGKKCGEMHWVALAKKDGSWTKLDWTAETGHL